MKSFQSGGSTPESVTTPAASVVSTPEMRGVSEPELDAGSSRKHQRSSSGTDQLRRPPMERRETHFVDVQIPVTDTIHLEGVLKIPNPPKTLLVNKIAIINHPWSWLGGNMDDPVLCGLSRAFLRLNYHVLLYNNRGVGASAGRSSFTGIPESRDLQQVVEWAINEVANVDTVVLVGYSWGSLITSLCPPPTRMFPDKINRSAHILLSHPLGPMHFLTCFHTSKFSEALDKLLLDPQTNLLVLYGSRDQWTGVKKYETWVQRLRDIRAKLENPKPLKRTDSSTATVRPSPPENTDSDKTVRPSLHLPEAAIIRPAPCTHGEYQTAVVHHADHFWRGEGGREMRQIVTDWTVKLDKGAFDIPDR
ncbi:hypothetical protein FRB99_000560 [Tulasnella sp. 403]|nr:hypothetical protein FRB99_000560 [Tulasnella sp. 403]